MPVTTGFEWNMERGPIFRSPLFQVYGTKRKNSEGNIEPNILENDTDLSFKRRCIWPADVKEQTPTQAMEINHNVPNQHFKQLQQEQNHISPDLPIPAPWSSELQSQLTSGNQPWQPVKVVPQNASSRQDVHIQPGNIMDLNDECYSMSEVEDACVNMDSDCVPDPQQYNQRENTNCPQSMCQGGNISPNSGLVRCFCKPNWDPLMDLRPYISDVY
ncbi:uncharacterized protein LOC106164714 [Lingula anatina]|uniref:Uncharacterized protein LOC106164714 n=1 Tax=Lingula anatina TaxID=7574 RepID=A0A1S3IJ80_LINAN|nr:uncharacterized protein LOC106164714 [Lingula anatina]|eukprot:XP_013398168.1 uncharacterized protein LOC106164714 [Lingula anatina]